MPRTLASRVSTALPSSSFFISSVRQAETTSRVSLSAMRHAAGVEDGAAHGGLDDLLDVVAAGLLLVLVAVADLEVPQPSAEGQQQRHHEDLDGDQPDVDARGAPGLRNVAHGAQRLLEGWWSGPAKAGECSQALDPLDLARLVPRGAAHEAAALVPTRALCRPGRALPLPKRPPAEELIPAPEVSQP